MKTNIYDQITEKVVAQLENGIIPWQKPWQNAAKGADVAISHETGKPYSELNQMLLGWRAGEWLTWKQVHAEGGRIKNGAKAEQVVFWSRVNKIEKEAICDENGDEIGIRDVITGSYMVLKGYPVFHISDTEGIEPKWNNEARKNEADPIEEAEVVAMNYIEREKINFEYTQSNEAWYSAGIDKVHVPVREQYAVNEEYYSTLFHELTHSTGHASRLNRKEVGTSFFGSENYSKEELVAEMGAAFLCNAVGINSHKAFRNSVAYIQSWLRVLKNDKRMITMAATKAEKACKYILNK